LQSLSNPSEHCVSVELQVHEDKLPVKHKPPLLSILLTIDPKLFFILNKPSEQEGLIELQSPLSKQRYPLEFIEATIWPFDFTSNTPESQEGLTLHVPLIVMLPLSVNVANVLLLSLTTKTSLALDAGQSLKTILENSDKTNSKRKKIKRLLFFIDIIFMF
jgi:hypothetical protein